MNVVHENVFRAKGYEPHRPAKKKQLKKGGKALLGTTTVYKRAEFFRKRVDNPEAGKILLVLRPVDVGSDQNMAVLLDQLEAIVTSPTPEPLRFQGERSPIFSFEAEQQVQEAQLSTRTVDGWQMKGFLYKPRHEETVGFPPNREYKGLGANPVVPAFDKKGNFKPSQARKRVCGTMTFDEVIFEMFYPQLLTRKTEWVSPPFGMGEFLSRPYSSSKEQIRTGFVIHFMEGVDRLRTPDFIKKILEQVQDPVLRSRIITEVYKSIGRMLSDVHELGVAMGQPHLDNFSFRLKGEALEARMHDFDTIIWRPDQTWPAFFGYTLFDLSAVSLMNVMAQQNSYGNVDIERSSRVAAREEGITLAEARANLETLMNYERIFCDESVVLARPLPMLFRSYFAEQGRELASLPDSLVDRVAENLQSNIVEYLQASGWNPYQGMYNEALLREALQFSRDLITTPLLLNRKLDKLNPQALIS